MSGGLWVITANIYYRPQTKFVNVMFSQVSVGGGWGEGLCPGVSVHGGLYPGWVCVQGVCV